jgi:hypothetical protein
MAVGTLGRLQEEAGGEAVRNYVTKGGEMRHVFQGYFETSHEVRTNKYNSQAWAVNFVATVVRHLESPRHWAAFVVRTTVYPHPQHTISGPLLEYAEKSLPCSDCMRVVY